MLKSFRLSLLAMTLAVVTISSSFSAEIVIAKIFKKSNNDQSILYITTDDKEDVVKFKFDILDSDGNIERSIPVSLSELKKGKVVLEKRGTDVITLKGSDVEGHNGGYITLTHLKQWRLFKKNEYKSVELFLDRVGDDWEVQMDGQVFKELYAHDHSKGINKFTIKK